MENFGVADWLIVAAYIGGNTLIGERLKGKQKSTKDFFLGGRSLPWYAVSASVIATVISAITFVGVPAIVYADGGNFTYLQFAIGAIIARFIVARFFIPLYYSEEFYSPYDYMAKRLGPVVGKVTAVMFFVGSVLGQGVRVYATALVLEVITGLDLLVCIGLITVFSIFWTWLGGIAAVVWTDFVQFFIFIAGALFALGTILANTPLSTSEIIGVAAEAGKLDLFNWAWDIHSPFIFWAAVFAMPFQNVTAFGVDQLSVQRLLCCGSAKNSQKALLWANLGELVGLLMLAVGAALWVFYQNQPIPPPFDGMVAEKVDRIFPVFIMTEVPTGMRGLLIAAIFATANSSLDSTLAALAQTSLTMFIQPKLSQDFDESRLVWLSRWLIVAWGVVLALMAVLCSASQSDLVNLAFSMTTYMYGPMLGIFGLAVFTKAEDMRSLMITVPLSMGIIFLFNHPEILNPILGTTYDGPWMAWPWLFPLGAAMVFVFSYGASRRSEP